MQLKTVVKVAEINNLSDARYCAGMGAQLLGFVMKHDEKEIISDEIFLAITGWIEGVEFVGEFWNASDEEILDKKKQLNFSYIQTDSVDQAKRLDEQGHKMILFQEELPLETIDYVQYVVVDNEKLVANEKLSEACEQNEIIFGGDVHTSHLNELLESYSIAGIQLKGGDEIRPGYKDFDELADILEALDDEA